MINLHYKTNFILEERAKTKDWIKKVIRLEGKCVGEINYIFCDDNYLLDHNIKYLNHNTLTDIISFNYSDKDIVSSDIMISIERVQENSVIFENPFKKELRRVMIHGILHLIGYDDKTKKDKKEMTDKEDFYLSMYS